MHSFLAGVVLLGVLVVVHELGHFAVAKLLGVRVEVFSVGFGPALLRIKRGETEYRLSLIPLGGYVRMLGETPWQGVERADKAVSFSHQALWKRVAIVAAGPLSNFVLAVLLLTFAFHGPRQELEPVVGTVLRGSAAEAAGIRSGDRLVQVGNVPTSTFGEVARQIRAYPDKSLPVVVQRPGPDGTPRRLHITATPTAREVVDPVTGKQRVGSLGLLHMVSRPRVWVTAGSIAAEAGLLSLDEIIQVDGIAVTSMMQLRAALADRADQNISLRIRRSDQSATVPSTAAQPDRDAGSRQVADQEQFTELGLVLPQAGTVPAAPRVEREIKRYAVTSQELQDVNLARQIQQTRAILARGGDQIRQQRGVMFAGDTIEHVEQGSWAAGLGLRRGDRVVAVAGRAAPHAFAVARELGEHDAGIHILGIVSDGSLIVAATRLGSAVVKTDLGPRQHAQTGLGIAWHQSYRPGAVRQRSVGLARALEDAAAHTGKLVYTTLTGLRLLVTGQAPVSQLAGPITIFSMAGEAARQGLMLYIFMMALISVNLGLLNVLPIPGLDGGHLLLFVLEAVRGRPLSLKWQMRVLQTGALVLLAVMAIALINDISRLLPPTGSG